MHITIVIAIYSLFFQYMKVMIEHTDITFIIAVISLSIYKYKVKRSFRFLLMIFVYKLQFLCK